MSVPAAPAVACTVLVVEDNPTGRKLLRLVLEAEGYRVVEAFDGATALKRMERDPPDLVIQDLILPDIDGLEFLRRFRALPAGAQVPVLALSGFRSILENAAGQPGGFDECLLKPVAPSRLVEIVRRYIPLPDPVASDLGKGRHVLVVDDDAIQLRLTALRLRQLGFRVSTSGEAVGAIALAVSHVPDLILSDVLMPGVDGFQLCQRARHQATLAHVPIILWAAHHRDEADHVLALRVGASALLSRAQDFQEIALAIVAAMESVRAGQQQPGDVAAEARDDAATDAEPISVAEKLTRQAAAHASLARRCALHAAHLAIIGGVADALSRSQDVDAVLDDVLAACLDAGGITRGALYRIGAGGRLAVEQAVGFAEKDIPQLESCFGHPGLLEEVKMGQTVLPSRYLRDAEVRSLLDTTRATALVIVPLAIADQCTGALLLASDLSDIGEEDLLAFGRAIGAYINQALGLAAAFQRVEAAAEAQRALFSCVEIDDTLRTIARMGTQHGDLCQVDLIRDGDVVQSEKAYRHPDRTTLHLEHELTVPLVAHGVRLAMMRIFRRTASYSQAERQAAEHLARTASVALHKAHLYRQAQAANQAKDDFLATMSHELRTPLTAVRLWTDKLRRRTSDPAVIAHGLAVIHDNARLQANLIDDILDVSRVVTGKLVLKIQQVDLEAIVAAAVQIMTPSADARAITIEVSFDPGTAMIVGDPQRLQQVVLNLLSNAVKFTGKGGLITIAVTRVSSCIELRVRDTGKGVDPAFLPFVFDQFRQADPSSTRAHGGLGLGLALVKSLVELHGGKVRAESGGIDQGAMFVVRLPVPAMRDYGLRPSGEDPRGEAPLRPDGERLKGLRLLVVDDEPEVRELIADLLAEFGAQVRAVASVKDAMRAFEEFKPNLLITDLGMPAEDGYELIRQVRLTSAVPAVALTAYVGEEDQRRVLASGFQMHLCKPVRPEVLLEAITGLAAGPLVEAEMR